MLQDTLAKWHTSHSSCFQRIYGDGSECCSPALKELYTICILRRSIKVIFILPLLLRETSSYQFLLGLEIRKYHFIFWPFKYSHCVNGRVPYLRHYALWEELLTQWTGETAYLACFYYFLIYIKVGKFGSHPLEELHVPFYLTSWISPDRTILEHILVQSSVECDVKVTKEIRSHSELTP